MSHFAICMSVPKLRETSRHPNRWNLHAVHISTPVFKVKKCSEDANIISWTFQDMKSDIWRVKHTEGMVSFIRRWGYGMPYQLRPNWRKILRSLNRGSRHFVKNCLWCDAQNGKRNIINYPDCQRKSTNECLRNTLNWIELNLCTGLIYSKVTWSN